MLGDQIFIIMLPGIYGVGEWMHVRFLANVQPFSAARLIS